MPGTSCVSSFNQTHFNCVSIKDWVNNAFAFNTNTDHGAGSFVRRALWLPEGALNRNPVTSGHKQNTHAHAHEHAHDDDRQNPSAFQTHKLFPGPSQMLLYVCVCGAVGRVAFFATLLPPGAHDVKRLTRMRLLAAPGAGVTSTASEREREIGRVERPAKGECRMNAARQRGCREKCRGHTGAGVRCVHVGVHGMQEMERT